MISAPQIQPFSGAPSAANAVLLATAAGMSARGPTAGNFVGSFGLCSGNGSDFQMETQPPVHVILLAGGRGTRLKPLSTKRRPKQFLNLLDRRRTMLQLTADRFAEAPEISPEKMWVLARGAHRAVISDQLPDVSEDKIITEPFIRNYNTLAIAAAMYRIALQDPDAVTIIVPTDHFIGSAQIFLGHVRDAVSLCSETGAIITFGIAPTFASPEYGYLERDDESPPESQSFRLKRFVEKPPLQTARRYLRQGNFFWNSGMYVWSAKTFMDLLAEYRPEIHEALAAIFGDGKPRLRPGEIERRLCNLPDLPIDRAIMERAATQGKIYAIPFLAQWSDVGTWQSLAKLMDDEMIDPPVEVARQILKHRGRNEKTRPRAKLAAVSYYETLRRLGLDKRYPSGRLVHEGRNLGVSFGGLVVRPQYVGFKKLSPVRNPV